MRRVSQVRGGRSPEDTKQSPPLRQHRSSQSCPSLACMQVNRSGRHCPGRLQQERRDHLQRAEWGTSGAPAPHAMHCICSMRLHHLQELGFHCFTGNPSFSPHHHISKLTSGSARLLCPLSQAPSAALTPVASNMASRLPPPTPSAGGLATATPCPSSSTPIIHGGPLYGVEGSVATFPPPGTALLAVRAVLP